MKKSNLFLIVFVVLFLIITTLVCIKDTLAIDLKVYQEIIQFQSESLTNFFKMITKFANVKFSVIFLLLFLLIYRKKEAIYLIITTIDIEIINLLMKMIFKRERPNILRLIEIDNYSYPSGHAMISMGMYGYLIYLIYTKVKNKVIKSIGIAILSILIILIGTSRIYLGVHHFSDIIAGYLLSIIYLIIFVKIMNNARGNKNVQANSK